MSTPSDDGPLPERILDAAEGVLRRHGAEKTNVVDIAKALGMSHGNIYRHFPSKKAILSAVAVRWLHQSTDPLETIAGDRSRPAGARLAAWFHAIRAAKRRKLRDDPELFRMHTYIVEHEREMVSDHVATLLGQVERILADGVAAGEFAASLRPPAAARAFLHATSPFHQPALVIQNPPPSEAEADALIDLLLAGLRAGGG